MSEKDQPDWRVPVDPHYSMLIRAVRRRVDEICRDTEGTVADLHLIRGAQNEVWCVVRLANTDRPFFLIHGNTTVGIREHVGGDVGVEVHDLPWEPPLIPLTSAVGG